uniref:Uncharacterized protein n=1 Tax=Magallana gigas TaxID=29159 RepID=K1QI72_MAGGI
MKRLGELAGRVERHAPCKTNMVANFKPIETESSLHGLWIPPITEYIRCRDPWN